VLRFIRSRFSSDELEIRVDANGAFKFEDALKCLKYSVILICIVLNSPSGRHPEKMAELCECSPIPVALDEELIGKHIHANRKKLLDIIMPQYIVLKPGLLVE